MEEMLRPLWRGLTAALVMGAAAWIGPATAEDLGPPVGSQAPSIGTPQDQTGMPRSLDSLMGERGLVLAFVRSADWCPFCKAQLAELNEGLDQITGRGYQLASLSYDSVETLDKVTKQRGIGFAMLSDPDSTVIDRYGLRDPAYPEGHRAHGVPRPIVFVIGTGGVIKDKLYEETFRERPPLTVVLAALDE